LFTEIALLFFCDVNAMDNTNTKWTITAERMRQP